MPKILFRYDNGAETVSFVPSGTNLLEAARNAGVSIDAPCAGNGVCGKCRVKLLSGELLCAKSLHITEDDLAAGYRLACVSKVMSDVVIAVPNTASDFKAGIRTTDITSEREMSIFRDAQTALQAEGITQDNGFSLVTVTLAPPTLSDTMPDNERLAWALEKQTGFPVVFSSTALLSMSRVLRDNCFSVTCTTERRNNTLFVYGIYPDNADVKVCGVAIDIGTTTVSALLIDLLTGDILSKASAGNGQIEYGSDVINRIIASCREGGSERLQKAIMDTVRSLISALCANGGIQPGCICRMTVAGNTTMNHLFLGLYADPIRMEPYIPTFFETDVFKGSDFSLGIHNDATIVIAPNIGSYVGGDITAGTLVSMIWNKPDFSLLVDLGTNGELVFGNSDFLMSCACSAGPAFEGGDMSCGMRATVGAIEACTIDKDTMQPTVTVVGGGDPIGLCGSGLIDTVSELFRCGIIDARGSFVRDGERVLCDESGIHRYVIAAADADRREVSISEVDIANFIRAKGAIFSAIRTMLTSLDMDVSVISNVYVAGGIGSGINIKNAITLGMLPDLPLDCYHYIGNASLAGAYSMTVSPSAQKKVSEIARSITYLELSAEPGYMEEFVAACFLPHTDSSLFPSE